MEAFNETSEVNKVVDLDRKPADGAASTPLIPEALVWQAVVTGIASFAFLASLILLNHIFTHQENTTSKAAKADKTNYPSWVYDSMVIASFLIATICGIVAPTVLLRWRKPVMMNDQKQTPDGSETFWSTLGSEACGFTRWR